MVDDKPERLLTYEVILERLNQNLVRALSGEEAYAKLKEMEFAAILLDVSMPGLDGFETAALIRGDPRIGSTPIIFVTGVAVTLPLADQPVERIAEKRLLRDGPPRARRAC